MFALGVEHKTVGVTCVDRLNLAESRWGERVKDKRMDAEVAG